MVNTKKYALLICIGLSVAASIYLLSLRSGNSDTALHTIHNYNLDTSDIFDGDKSDKIETKKARYEYFLRLLRDPVTNSIPQNIRRLEMDFARSLPKRSEGGGFNTYGSSRKSLSNTSQYIWQGIGPNDVGGRTRALGIDVRNPDIIIAGGVSGGMWKSIDGGNTWEIKSDLNQNMSVTDVTQDPNNPEVWYYASGEFVGNSASDRGFRAFYLGTGIFKSTDNGESWTRLAVTEDISANFDSEFDYVSRVVINPTTASLFVASNGFGIYKSTDGGASFSPSPVLGSEAGQVHCTIEVAAEGTLIASLSQDNFGSTSYTPGIYFSTDDGVSWTNVTPPTFPSTHGRTVLGIAPSDNKIFYSYTQKGSGNSTNQGISFHKFTLNSAGDDTSSTEDRSANLPDFGDPVGDVNTQGGYNMILSVKPDDPDFVLLGATNLFRSTDGFATSPSGSGSSEKNKFWIGGYANVNNVTQYEHHHPDQHALVFDPNNPNRLWSGHDGALSVTEDITATEVTWIDRDDGYITSQFYTVTAPEDSASGLLVGGTQDNGTPFFNLDDQNNQIGDSGDASSGDGSYAAFTKNDSLLFTSSQNGRVLRFDLENSTYGFASYVQPISSQNRLFIHPYVVDRTTMYYPDVSSSTGQPRMWINNYIDEISNSNGSGTSQDWNNIELTDIPSGYLISTLEASRIPEDILFYAASSSSSPPRIFKASDASSSFNVTEISISTASSGTYVHDIALNPINADEAIAVFSNYNVVGIYHTNDGGETWNEIEGNLEGDNSTPGPSIRTATILPLGSSTIYMVGTSTGLYSTEILDGANTIWMQESSSDLGNSVVEFLNTRFDDAAIMAATHGRGVYKGTFQGTITSPGPPSTPAGFLLVDNENDVELSWSASQERDIAGYNIYRGAQPRSFSLIGSSATTSFTDPNGTISTFYYAISALDAEGNESMLTMPLGAFRSYLTVGNNWQLVGSPLLSSNDANIPDEAQLVGFEGTYKISVEMEQSRGYWIKNAETDSIKYTGSAPSETAIPLNQGWNLISGISDTVLVGNLEDPNSILSSTPVKRYVNGAYQDASEIAPNEGYFVHAFESGNIFMRVDTSSAAATKAFANQTSDHFSEFYDELYFTVSGRSQKLFIARDALNDEQRQYYLMPPMAPGNVLDVRTSKGYRIVDKDETEIRLNAPAYPLRVSLTAAENNDKNVSYRLVAYRGEEEVYFDLTPGNPAIIEKEYDRFIFKGISTVEIPQTTDLFPNYPNPFNPSTTIKYQLSRQSEVSLEVYNVIGRRVRTIVDQVQQAGTYSVVLNGSNLASGTYFVKIQAGDFSKIRKMSLIK